MWGYQGTFYWDRRNIQPWAVVAQPSYFSHAFSLAGCPRQQESEEFASPAPPLSQQGSREASQKPAVMVGENAAEGVLLGGCMSVLVFIGCTYKHTEEMERLAVVGVSQATWLSQQGCTRVGGFTVLPWDEIIQIIPCHTCPDR